VLARIKAQAGAPSKDAADVAATRWAWYEAPAEIDLPVEASSGGRTEGNHVRLGIARTHAFDSGGSPFVRAVLSEWAMPTESTPGTAASSSRERLWLAARAFSPGRSRRSYTGSMIDLMTYGKDVMDSTIAAFDAQCGLLKLGVDS
jgi:hypothetical protein